MRRNMDLSEKTMDLSEKKTIFPAKNMKKERKTLHSELFFVSLHQQEKFLPIPPRSS